MRLSTAALVLFGVSRSAAAFGGVAMMLPRRVASNPSSRAVMIAAAAAHASLGGTGSLGLSSVPIVSAASSAGRTSLTMSRPSACPTTTRISQTLLGATHTSLYSRGGSISAVSTSASSSTTALNSAIATEAEAAAPVEKFRSDYRPLPHLVTKISMDFNIADGETLVTSKLTIEPNPKFNALDGDASTDLVLDGDESSVSLTSLSIDGRALEESTDYQFSPGTLTIKSSALKPGAVLESTVKIVPEDNTQLSGLYKSGPMYCSQCEATGFRRITYCLNVFNTAYVLADEKTASDVDYERVEGVIGHEYFHNWTGNRVTCRDWFQLTLKEGLTVFRDQEFSGDMGSNAVKRIEDVRSLRGRQFNEDAGPMSHPIRPESYISMDNFYTATVYSKGAEIIRMYNTLLGADGFRKGMDLYFKRHDGTGVTCDDFRAAMADANGVDLEQFGLWYSTPGTPTVTHSSSFDDATGTFTLTLSQTSKADNPLHIPVSVGLIDKSTGEEVVPTTVLELKEERQIYDFPGLQGDVVPSILRDFSAPVKLVSESGSNDEAALAFLAARDTDGFNRWEAGQVLYTDLIFQNMNQEVSDTTREYVNEAFHRTLVDSETADYSIQAYALTLPSESTLAEELDVVDPVAIHEARGAVKKAIARKFQEDIKSKYDELTKAMDADGTEFKVDAVSVGRRRLRNVLLDYLCSIKETAEEQKAAAELASAQFEAATGMTDKYAALSALASMDGEGARLRDEALLQFYDDADGDALVLNKWFTVQALADLPDVLDRVKALTKHPDFTLSNPNRCRSLVSAFTMNAAPFHAESGDGYKFVADIIMELDKLNPQISSRMGGSLIQWKRYNEERGALMKAELERLVAMKPISDDLFEVVSRGLK
mmetsp:Transcript_2792/g.5820  ORF Transcript_2792/g.5820 Transcript_2792/m.5820 type:complete len:882 (+) Transcript_2792:33-2678(+)